MCLASFRVTAHPDRDRLHQICTDGTYNTLRLMVTWEDLQPTQGEILDGTYMATVLDIVRYAADHVMQVIVCVSQRMFSVHCTLPRLANQLSQAHGAPRWAVPKKHRDVQTRAYIYIEEEIRLWEDFHRRWVVEQPLYIHMLAQLAWVLSQQPCVLGIQPIVDPKWPCRLTGRFHATCLGIEHAPPTWFFSPACGIALRRNVVSLKSHMDGAEVDRRVVWCLRSQSSDTFAYITRYTLMTMDWVFRVPKCKILFIATELDAVQQARRVALLNDMFPWGWDEGATRKAMRPLARCAELVEQEQHLRTRLLQYSIAVWMSGMVGLAVQLYLTRTDRRAAVSLGLWAYGQICVCQTVYMDLCLPWPLFIATGYAGWSLLIVATWTLLPSFFILCMTLALWYSIWTWLYYQVVQDFRVVAACRNTIDL